MSASNTGPTVDSAAPSPQPSPDDTKRAASESMRAGVDIRAKIHDVTLLALRNRRFDLERVKREIRFWLERDVQELYLMDPVFNLNAERAKEIHLLMNNCYGDKAVNNAAELSALLD